MSNWFFFFTTSWGLPFTIYVVIQIIAAIKLRGLKRIMVLLPVPIMLIVIAVTFYGYQQQSNLWPIYLIFVSPLAILYVAIMWLVISFKKQNHHYEKQRAVACFKINKRLRNLILKIDMLFLDHHNNNQQVLADGQGKLKVSGTFFFTTPPEFVQSSCPATALCDGGLIFVFRAFDPKIR